MSHPDYAHLGEPEDKVIEEVGELLQAIGKAHVHGYESYHPDTPDITNIMQIVNEINDVEKHLERYMCWLEAKMSVKMEKERGK